MELVSWTILKSLKQTLNPRFLKNKLTGFSIQHNQPKVSSELRIFESSDEAGVDSGNSLVCQAVAKTILEKICSNLVWLSIVPLTN